MKRVRTRFAPSPTGPLHMGGIRTALYNYLFARKHNGDFVLRIEDTDKKREIKDSIDHVIKTLEWCGIIHDEGEGMGGNYGPYVQSQRLVYAAHAHALVCSGHAYYAFDTKEEIAEMKMEMEKAKIKSSGYNHITRERMKNSLVLSEDEVNKKLDKGELYVIRFKMPRNEQIKFNDEIRGTVSFNTSTLDDKVLLKEDGIPTYHLANVVDDHLMEISHVIRGDEWLPSTPLHVMLYRALGWDTPIFAHLPLILGPDGKKLSSRHSTEYGFPILAVEWQDPKTGEIADSYQRQGFYPDAFVNAIVFLGWNPGTTKEIFSFKELVEEFSLERVGRAGAMFDYEKVKWFNQMYLRKVSSKELAKRIRVVHDLSSKNVERACELMKERAVFPSDIETEGLFFFKPPSTYDQKVIDKRWKDDTSEGIKNIRIAIEKIKDFSLEEIVKTFESQDLRRHLPNLRLLVTGVGKGPSMVDILSVIGKEETIRRIDSGLSAIDKMNV